MQFMHRRNAGTPVRKRCENVSEINESYIDIVTEAASTGDMLSAKYRLAQMYRTGENVEKDSAEAVRWYSLAAMQAINELERTPTLASAETVFSILFDLGEHHYEIGDSQRAIKTFLRLQSILDSLPEDILCRQTDRWMQICSNKLGGLYERTAKPESAYEHFRRALVIAERAAENDDSELALDDLAVASYRVGFIDHLFRGETKRLDRAHALWNSLYERTGNYDYRRKKCVIDTLYATADIPSPEERAGTAAALPTADDTAVSAVIEPVGDSAAADSMTAELSRYISEYGYSRSSPLDGKRPLFEALAVIVLIALCIWAYFSGTFHEIFRFFRNL